MLTTHQSSSVPQVGLFDITQQLNLDHLFLTFGRLEGAI